MALIAIDFDNTINNNLDIEKGERYSKPFPNAKDYLHLLKQDGHKIMIFSCNRTKWIEEWMNHWELPFDFIWDAAKPIADVYVDDRGVGFRGDWTATYNEIKTLVSKVGK